MKRSIFSSTFNESQNLLNDFFWKQNGGGNNTNKNKVNKSKESGDFFTLLCCFFIVLPSLFISYVAASSGGYISFISYSIFSIGLIIFLISWVVFFLSPNYLKPFIKGFNLFFIGPIWIIINTELLLFSGASKYEQIYLFIFMAILIISLVITIKHRIHLFKALLFNDREYSVGNNMKKFVHILYVFVPMFISIYIIIKVTARLLFHITFKVNYNFFGICLMLFILSLVLILFEVYMILPPILFGYYLHKYPEEYRKFEKKTYQQWYGKLYLKFKGLKDNETNK